MYSPRIGRRWEIDPVVKYHESPYATFGNNPIWFADPNGADTITFNINSTTTYHPKPENGLDRPGLYTAANNYGWITTTSTSMDLKVAEGKDVFFFNKTYTTIDENGNSSTVSESNQFYPVENRKQGLLTEPYFLGFGTYRMTDREVLAELAPKELLNYLMDKTSDFETANAYKDARGIKGTLPTFRALRNISEIAYSMAGFNFAATRLTSLLFKTNPTMPALGIAKYDDLVFESATADELVGYATAYENMYKAGRVGSMTKSQAAYFGRILNSKGVPFRVDAPHAAPNPWNMPHLNVGNKYKIHVPFDK